MATLESLTAQLPTDLSALLMDPAQQAAMEQMLVDRARGDIERSAGNEAQRVSEAAFGRGMGLSSLNAYAQGEVDRARAEALSKARIDANTNALAAQRAALGQAAQYVTAQNAQRQQADQFKKNLAQQKSMNTQNLIGGGLAGLAGGAMKTAGHIWGDDIKKFLGGLGKPTAAGGGGGSFQPSGLQGGNFALGGAQMSPIEANLSSIQAPESAAPADGGLEGLAFGDGGGYVTPTSYDFGGSYGGGDNFDLSSLYDFGGGDWGNTDLDELVSNNWSW